MRGQGHRFEYWLFPTRFVFGESRRCLTIVDQTQSFYILADTMNSPSMLFLVDRSPLVSCSIKIPGFHLIVHVPLWMQLLTNLEPPQNCESPLNPQISNLEQRFNTPCFSVQERGSLRVDLNVRLQKD